MKHKDKRTRTKIYKLSGDLPTRSLSLSVSLTLSLSRTALKCSIKGQAMLSIRSLVHLALKRAVWQRTQKVFLMRFWRKLENMVQEMLEGESLVYKIYIDKVKVKEIKDRVKYKRYCSIFIIIYSLIFRYYSRDCVLA